MKVEVDVMSSLSLIVLVVTVDLKQTSEEEEEKTVETSFRWGDHLVTLSFVIITTLSCVSRHQCPGTD